MAASARHFIAYFNLQFDPLIALTKLASSSTYTSLRPQKPTIVKCAFVEWCVRVSFKCSQLIASCPGIYALRSEFSVNFFTFNLSCMSQLFCGIHFHAIHIHTYIQTCGGNLEVLIFNFFFFLWDILLSIIANSLSQKICTITLVCVGCFAIGGTTVVTYPYIRSVKEICAALGMAFKTNMKTLDS